MKKIVALMLVIACVFALASCGGSNEVDDVAAMYENSNPTKVVIKTSQSFGEHVLNGEYVLVSGLYNGKNAAVYIEKYDRMLSVEEGATDKVVDAIETYENTYEYVEGAGVRTNGGEWDAAQSSFVGEKGIVPLNLKSGLVSQYQYANHKLACIVVAKNTAEVLGLEENLSTDVIIEVVDDGASVNYVNITYTIPADEASGVEETTVSISAEYTYNLEQITIG